MLKVLFVTLLTGCFGIFAAAQDTIDHYRNSLGERCTFEEGIWFLKETGDPQKPLEIYHMYNLAMYENHSFEKPTTTVRNGSYVFVNEKGAVMRTASYTSDKETGKCITYYEDGTVSDMELFADGKHEGVSDYYYPNGQLSSRETYAADSLIAFELYNEDGSRDLVTTTPTEYAEFPGGIVGMRRFLGESLIYPRIALELGLEGRCHLQFRVDTTGRISNVEIKRGVPDCPECDAEAMRVVKLMPDWKPARIHNRIEASTFNLPVSFKFQEEEKERKKRKSRD